MDQYERENSSYLEKFILYMKSLDSNWENKIKPASSEQIQELLELCGLKQLGFDFPAVYYEYLSVMGLDDGGLLEKQWDGYYIEVSLTDLVTFYQFEAEEEEEERSKRLEHFQYVFLNHWTEALMYFDVREGDNPPIYYDGVLYSQSFEKYLYQMEFKGRIFINYPFAEDFGTSPIQMEVLLRQQQYGTIDQLEQFWEKPMLTQTPGNGLSYLVALLEELGFEKLWFSDRVNYCGYLTDVSIMCHGEDGFWGSLKGSDREQVEEMKERIEKYLWVDKEYVAKLYSFKPKNDKK